MDRQAGGASGPGTGVPTVDILGLRFPRLTRDQAIALLVERIRRRETTAVCIPDMSTMNLAADDPGFHRILRDRMLLLNDGVGMDWAAARQGRPFPANLNGTDLTPRLLAAVPEGTRVFVVGARPGDIERAAASLAERFPRIEVVGAHHGYLDAAGDDRVADAMRAARPDLVLVGMGNPTQVRFIDRHLDDPSLAGTTWIAVGGFFDYWAGSIRRVSPLLRKAGLEWLGIVFQQPHKARRYFLGIPRFAVRCVMAQATGRHAAPVEDDGGIGAAPDAGARLRARVKAAGRRLAVEASRLAPGDPDAPRILCYHGVSEAPADEWSVTAAQLGEQMAWLRAARTPVPIERIAAWVRGDGDLPARATAVTFDDGYLDVLRRAAPVLAEAGVPGAAFVAAGLLDGQPPDPGWTPLRALMDWDQVRELLRRGWTIGSHGLTHAAVARLSDQGAAAQIGRSRERLEARLGVRVGLIAFPYGTPSTVSDRDRRMARESGYDAAFLAVGGPVARGADPYAIPRDKLYGTDGPEVARAVIEGRLDLWGRVERRR